MAKDGSREKGEKLHKPQSRDASWLLSSRTAQRLSSPPLPCFCFWQFDLSSRQESYNINNWPIHRSLIHQVEAARMACKDDSSRGSFTMMSSRDRSCFFLEAHIKPATAPTPSQHP